VLARSQSRRRRGARGHAVTPAVRSCVRGTAVSSRCSRSRTSETAWRTRVRARPRPAT